MKPDRLLGPESLVLVTGGARGITATCVVELARRHRARFVLVGRTATDQPLPGWADPGLGEAELKRHAGREIAARGERAVPREIQRRYGEVAAQMEVERTLRAVAEAGGEARYVRADVSDLAALRAALATALEKSGPVTGIIHAAGALADRRLEQKTASDLDRVLGPKVQGLANLLRLFPAETLRFLFLFSSGAAFYGNAGQGDYALANEVLNKAAHLLSRRHAGCRVTAFDWGPWEGGMVTAAHLRLFEKRGISVIPAAEGAGILADRLAAHAPAAPQLLVGSPMPAAPVPLALPLRTWRIERLLTRESSPFLRDHVVGRYPVVPAICAMAWMIDACEQRRPGFRAVSMDECRVLAGIVLDPSFPGTLSLELRETAVSPEAGTVEVDATILGATSSGRPRPHYRTRVTLGREAPESPSLPATEPASTPLIDGASLYADGTLFHGPSFQGVRRVLALDDRGLVLECELAALSERDQGQFPAGTLNPYVADALFVAPVVWMRRMRGVASLPLAAERVELYRPLRFGESYFVRLEVREIRELGLRCDATAYDAGGRVHMRLLGAEVGATPGLDRLFVPAATG